MNRQPYRNLYIHVPFCLKKCDYCAFYSLDHCDIVSCGERWLNRIHADLLKEQDRLQALDTVYFGGGTPTIFEPDFLKKMFQTVFSAVRTVPSAEITSEANPETITAEKAEILAQYVNRISMGVQSFSTEKRAVLGRFPATAENVSAAEKFLRAAGLRNLGFDLMYAVPGETLADWQKDLESILALQPRHVSCYALTPEEHTPYAMAHGLAPVDEVLSSDMWHLAGDFLGKHGLMRYEISNYAVPGFEARHNHHVWLGESYLGVGPSAASFDGVDRFTQIDDLEEWLAGKAPEMDSIPRSGRLREILMMGLRTCNGWQSAQWQKIAGKNWTDDPELMQVLHDLNSDGLLIVDDQICRPTLHGLEFWNEIALRLM